MKSIIELAVEAGLDCRDADNHCRESYWSATDDELQAFAALLKAEWLKEAGEMPEPFADVVVKKDKRFYIEVRILKPQHQFALAQGKHPLVTVAQCQQAVAAAVARKDAEIARLTAACNKFSEDEMLLTLTAERDALKALVSQQLTTEQVQRAKQALYEASHGDLEATDDEVKAAISVDLPYVWP